MINFSECVAVKASSGEAHTVFDFGNGMVVTMTANRTINTLRNSAFPFGVYLCDVLHC